jgi:hypothetical protein
MDASDFKKINMAGSNRGGMLVGPTNEILHDKFYTAL